MAVLAVVVTLLVVGCRQGPVARPTARGADRLVRFVARRAIRMGLAPGTGSAGLRRMTARARRELGFVCLVARPTAMP